MDEEEEVKEEEDDGSETEDEEDEILLRDPIGNYEKSLSYQNGNDNSETGESAFSFLSESPELEPSRSSPRPFSFSQPTRPSKTRSPSSSPEDHTRELLSVFGSSGRSPSRWVELLLPSRPLRSRPTDVTSLPSLPLRSKKPSTSTRSSRPLSLSLSSLCQT